MAWPGRPRPVQAFASEAVLRRESRFAALRYVNPPRRLLWVLVVAILVCVRNLFGGCFSAVGCCRLWVTGRRR